MSFSLPGPLCNPIKTPLSPGPGPLDDGVGPIGPVGADPAGRGNIGDAGFADGHDAVGPFHHFTGPYGKTV